MMVPYREQKEDERSVDNIQDKNYEPSSVLNTCFISEARSFDGDIVVPGNLCAGELP